MKINKLLMIIPLFLISNVYAREVKEEYVLLHWMCPYAIDRQFSTTEIGSPSVYNDYDKNRETGETVTLYTKEECVNEIKNKMNWEVGCTTEYSSDDYIKYIGGGLYTEGIGYYRYACAKYEDIKDYIDKEDTDYLKNSELPKEFFQKCPSEVDENNLQIFNNIFPLDENEKESIEFTKKFDEEVRIAMKKKLKEVREEQRIEREKKNRERRERNKNK